MNIYTVILLKSDYFAIFNKIEKNVKNFHVQLHIRMNNIGILLFIYIVH